MKAICRAAARLPKCVRVARTCLRSARIAPFPTTLGVAMALAGPVGAETCPNSDFRVGFGARLPDCRAYELVTPPDKGATQDIFVTNDTAGDKAIPAVDGESVAFETSAKLGDNPGPGGSTYIFTRGTQGWEMASIHPVSGSAATLYRADIFAPDLAEAGVFAATYTNFVSHSPDQTFYAGPAGGPYNEIAPTLINDNYANHPDELLGASEDFRTVILGSTDHSLLAGSEGPVAQSTVDGAFDLYEWNGAQLKLVNVTNSGSLVSSCGAELGYGRDAAGEHANDAVSRHGTRVFFTSPDPHVGSSVRSGNTSCEEPQHLYVRLNGNKTVDVSTPEAGVNDPSGFQSVFYEVASDEGSKVFFRTSTELTADDTGHEQELYMYDLGAHQLTRISHGESGTAIGAVTNEPQSPIAVSSDGSVVYFTARGQLTHDAPAAGGKLYWYDTLNDTTHYIASEASLFTTNINATTSNGEFLLFRSSANQPGYTSNGYETLYRYDRTANSIVCVSCVNGEATGGATLPTTVETVLATPDATPALNAMSDDGRYVFFVTAAGFSSQDTNGIRDVYEWEQQGTGGCSQSGGCLSLLSSGTSAVESTLLGASEDGSNVFLATHTQLVPQDKDELGDIYDARIDGGFAAVAQPSNCVSDCQTAVSVAPMFGTPASVSFVGVGDAQRQVVPAVKKSKQAARKRKLAKALKVCARKSKKRRARCRARARARYAKMSHVRRAGRRGTTSLSGRVR
jgi:hypothetical protein